MATLHKNCDRVGTRAALLDREEVKTLAKDSKRGSYYPARMKTPLRKNAQSEELVYCKKREDKRQAFERLPTENQRQQSLVVSRWGDNSSKKIN